jgi:hypothetical protein
LHSIAKHHMLWPSITQNYGVVVSDSAHSICESGLQRQEIISHPTVKCHDVNSRTHHPAIIYPRGIVLYCKALYALAIHHPVLWGRGVRLGPLDFRPSEARNHTSSHSEMPRCGHRGSAVCVDIAKSVRCDHVTMPAVSMTPL